jgi:hypothetical protein
MEMIFSSEASVDFQRIIRQKIKLLMMITFHSVVVTVFHSVVIIVQ